MMKDNMEKAEFLRRIAGELRRHALDLAMPSSGVDIPEQLGGMAQVLVLFAEEFEAVEKRAASMFGADFGEMLARSSGEYPQAEE